MERVLLLATSSSAMHLSLYDCDKPNQEVGIGMGGHLRGECLRITH
jgi:hypothetical protein